MPSIEVAEDCIFHQMTRIFGKRKRHPVAQSSINGVWFEAGSQCAFEREGKLPKLKDQIAFQNGRDIVLGFVLRDGEVLLEFVDAGESGDIGQEVDSQISKIGSVPYFVAIRNVAIEDVFEIVLEQQFLVLRFLSKNHLGKSAIVHIVQKQVSQYRFPCSRSQVRSRYGYP